MKYEIQLGSSFWYGISFAAGCFGFGWIPFIAVFVLDLWGFPLAKREE